MSPVKTLLLVPLSNLPQGQVISRKIQDRALAESCLEVCIGKCFEKICRLVNRNEGHTSLARIVMLLGEL